MLIVLGVWCRRFAWQTLQNVVWNPVTGSGLILVVVLRS